MVYSFVFDFGLCCSRGLVVGRFVVSVWRCLWCNTVEGMELSLVNGAQTSQELKQSAYQTIENDFLCELSHFIFNTGAFSVMLSFRILCNNKLTFESLSK